MTTMEKTQGTIEMKNGYRFIWTSSSSRDGEIYGSLYWENNKPIGKRGWWHTNDPEKAAKLAYQLALTP